MAEEQTNVPVVGRVKTTYVYAAGALVVGIVGYAWWRNSSASSSSSAEAVDPLADIGATDYVNPNGYGNSTVSPAPVESDEIDTNAEWSQKVVEILSTVGYDPMLVTTALGKYLQRSGLTGPEKAAVIAGRAMVGDPPVGGPYPIIDALPSPTPSPVPTPGPRGSVTVRTHSGKTWAGPAGPGNWDTIARSAYAVPAGWTDYERLRSALAAANKIPRPWIKGYKRPGNSYNVPAKTVVYFPATMKI